MDDRTRLTLVRLHNFQLETLKLLKEIMDRGAGQAWIFNPRVDELSKRIQLDRELVLNPQEGEQNHA